MASRHELIGVFLGIRPRCQWENDDGSITIIGTVQEQPTSILSADSLDLDCNITIRGQIPNGGLREGLTYRFYGQTRTHDTYGDQFCFESYVMDEPAGQTAIVAYLSQCKGIGPKTAYELYATFGDDAVEKIRIAPEEVAERMPRLPIGKLREASTLLKGKQKNERAKISLLGLLKGRGFPKNVIEKLIEDYGIAAGVVVQRNPYCLMRYKGCGFLKTDKMYLDLRHNPARMKRQALCAWNAVANPDRNYSGDTWLPFSVVRDALRANIASAKVDVERAMTLAIRGGLLVETYHQGQRLVAERAKADQEARLAMLIEEARTESAPVQWSTIAYDLDDITDHQSENLQLATSGFIGIYAGRPGTGKTFTVARLVKQLCGQFGSSHIAICSPTGKAAVRVSSAMEAAGVTLRATTVHSLLGMASGDRFRHNRLNTLPFKFIICDESSMLSVPLMCSLLEARAEGCHVLFVGDPNQLSPVGHGAPLRDMLMAGISQGTLTEIQRNSGRIVKACGEIIDHKRMTPSAKLDIPNGENLLLIQRDTPEVQIETLTAVMQNYQRRSAAGGFAEDPGPLGILDPIWDVQIIVAVNAKSPLGRKPLNLILQQLLNPDGKSAPGNLFRVGDKIICQANGQYTLIGDSEND